MAPRTKRERNVCGSVISMPTHFFLDVAAVASTAATVIVTADDIVDDNSGDSVVMRSKKGVMMCGDNKSGGNAM